MTRTIDTQQSPLWVRSELVRVDLIRLTTYSDRAAKTVDKRFYFARQRVTFNFDEDGEEEFWPYLKEIGALGSSINHLSSPGDTELLRKPLEVTLSNEPHGDERLIAVLRDGHTIENATIEWTQIALSERPTTARIDLTDLTGDEHTFRYRGRVVQVGPITNETITLRCELDMPRRQYLRATDATKVDPEHMGLRVASVYGSAKKVPAINWDVGFLSTLATAISDTAVSLELSDATGFGSSGTGTLGGEQVSWTGKSTNTLTGVTRGGAETAACNHPAGDLLVEAITTATFLVADHQVDAIGDVYVRNPYSGSVVRLTTDFTKTVADAVTVAGSTVASITFTQAQLLEALKALAASPEVTADDLSTPPANEQRVICESLDTDGTYADEQSRGLPAVADGRANIGDPYFSMNEDNYFYCRFFRPDSGFPRQRIRVALDQNAVSGTATLSVYKGRLGIDTTTLLDSQTITPGKNVYDIDTTEDAEWISVEVTSTVSVTAHVYEVFQLIDNTISTMHQQADYGNNNGAGEVSSGNWFDENDSTYVSPATGAWTGVKFSDPPPGFDTQRIRMLAEGLDGNDERFEIETGDGYTSNMVSIWDCDGNTKYEPWPERSLPGDSLDFEFESESDKYYVRVDMDSGYSIDLYELSRDYVTYGAPPAPDVAIEGASIGYGLRLFVDVDGYEAPDGTYNVASGVLLEHPADIMRHMIEEIGGGTIDATTYATCYTNLGAGAAWGVDTRTLGLRWEEQMARMAFEARATIVPEEAAAGTVWKLLTALSTYAFPAASGLPITEWDRGGFIEADQNADFAHATRFVYHYAADWSRGDGEEAFTAIVVANQDVNDLTVPSTANFEAAVDKIGDYEAEPVGFRCIQEEATAEEIAGYYCHERIAVPRALFAIKGVPWWDGNAYAIEVGDIVNVTPPWASAAVKSRVLEYVKDPATEQIELRLVEVE